jgi:hypothetical protein
MAEGGTQMKAKTLAIAILPVMLLLSPACLIVDHEGPHCVGDLCGTDLGDIAFYWSFEMWDGYVTDSCYDSEVAFIDVIIYDAWGDVEFEALNRPCGDLGAEIDNFYPGTYDLQLVAFCRSGMITHEGYWEMEIYEGYNDYGTLTLPYLGDCL